MKIIEIYIYGYGKFENVKFTNILERQVFFGENEAGKSTIMSFIHSILFGFPTKQQSELRYEPKKGAKYGGQLTVLIPNKGRVVIERVKGKAAGDVVVRLENGMIGGEDLLKELLLSIDKQLYQAIFSFNLQGLQNVHQMKGDELGRFLFSTGTIGSDVLLKAENELMKELDSRFKPNGRNPKLNSKLKELRGLRSELRKQEENNEQYTSLLHKRDMLENRIRELKSELISFSAQHTRLEEWKKVLPLLQKEKQLQQELSPYHVGEFPDKGLEELERLKQFEQELERKRVTLQQRIERLKEDLHSLNPNVPLIEKENELMKAIENIPLIEKWEQENIQLQVKLNKLEEEINLFQNKMHLSLTADEVGSMNTSVFMKEKTAALHAKQKRLTEKKQELDERFQEETRQLEELEAKERFLKDELLPETERKKLQEQVSFASRDRLNEKYDEVKNRLALLTNALQNSATKMKRDRLQYLLFAILFLILCGWGIFSDHMILILAGGAGAAFAIFSYVKVLSASEPLLQTEIKQLQTKKQQLENDLRHPMKHIELMEQKLERDQKLREQFNQLKTMINRQQELYDQVIDRYEAWEKASLQLNKELQTVGEELRLPREMALHYLYDAFELIDGLKRLYQEQRFINEQYAANKIAIEERLAPIRGLMEEFIEDDELSFQEAVQSLKRALREELDKQIKFKEKAHQLEMLQDEYQVYQLEWDRLGSEMSALLSSASANSEQHFRELARKSAEKSKLLEELNHIKLQLKLSSFTEKEAERFSERPVEESILEVLHKREMHEGELAQLQEEFAAIKYQIQMLEEGGSYAELLHRFRQLKSEFEEEAREWAKFAAARELLQKTVNQYKQERLPKMLRLAEEYLQFLTDNRYIRIIPKQEGSGFFIESKEQLLYDANELSQATTEQIYVSLRLAIALTVYEKYKFPIIIDDSFVNFDRERTSRVIDLLKQLKDYQLLFFTCHEHLLAYFQEKEIAYLNKHNTVELK
ncbi:AAA family ATPase [Bacillus tuaregi]|uniref:AAA family ATPase n=1 Tax=Bacillus tuaregi TaxID=1816695 RepID=UPI0008F8809A|nr:AAA family ATPase [Bacillus tuaregi]